MSEQKKQIVRSLIDEVWAGGNLSRLEQLVDPEIVANFSTERKPMVGLTAYRELYAAYDQLVGQIEFTVEDQLVDGDKVATRWTARRSKTSGSPSVMGMSIHRLPKDRITESWDTWDMLSMLETKNQ